MLKTAELNGSRPILFISEIVCVQMHLVVTSDRLCYGDVATTCYVFFYMFLAMGPNIIFKASLYRNG